MHSKISLDTAYSHNAQCFVCGRARTRRNNLRLNVFNPDSISYAYKNFRIILKNHARCCPKHLKRDGMIKRGHYRFIQTTPHQYDAHFLHILNSYRNHEKTIFEKFRDIKTLDDDLSMRITGWSKVKFLTFSR
jgi:hypothetical protein